MNLKILRQTDSQFSKKKKAKENRMEMNKLKSKALEVAINKEMQGVDLQLKKLLMIFRTLMMMEELVYIMMLKSC